ncbi:ABC transporter permease [Antrihabitans sp. YC2-6]|uniref:ABC transporter permease n=1 Tax=Antrihabitans sp. YC2-6 TaxID=2799498 RepID=UPI0018F3A799|nr:ABC transporter permease [Antrihabitans sp. YC2-6]MBJ8346113.1 ABC transporter permease [Antrihabitans sp. YC2-6]
MNSIVLVAKREILVKVQTRSFLIINALLIVVIVVGLILLAAFTGNDDDEATKVGLVGDSVSLQQTLEATGAAAGTPIDVVPIDSREAARLQVDDGDVEAALVGREVVVKEELPAELAAVLQATVQQQVINEVLAGNGVDPAELAAAVESAKLTTTETEPRADDYAQRLALSLVAAVLLLIGVANFAPAVGVGVTEEKSSRVVELLLSTIKPLHLLWGKILGLGVIGFVQVAVLAATGLITARATGLLEIPDTAISVLVAALVWFVLGFIFFATLYAAGGSMVSRVEEINSTTLPVMLLLMSSAYLGFFGVNDLDNGFYRTISLIPPFSSTLMPMQIAAGNANAAEIVGSLALMIAACALVAWIAAGVYQRSVLRTGARVSWRAAIGR